MSDELLECLEGTFSKIIYKSDNYMVSVFRSDEGSITITGPSFDYEEGMKYKLTGSYVDHPKYGFQFNVSQIEKLLPHKKDDIISFLASDLFKGIGKKTAERIYDEFKDDTISVLKEDISRIYSLKLTPKQYLAIETGIKSLEDPKNDILFYLISNGFNNLDAQKIFARFKLATKEIVGINPFRYYLDVYGMSFNKVKEFAAKQDFPDREIKFKEAYLVYAITEITFNTGDMFVKKDDLYKQVNKSNYFNDFEEILGNAIDDNYIVLEDDRCYLYDDYNDEMFIAEYLMHFDGSLPSDEYDIDSLIEENENDIGISYDDKQKDAIRAFFENGISIIEGGPGTGKTTIVKAMISIFNECHPYNNIIVIAPTGRAAKRINEMCDVESKTIHSLLRWNKETNTFVYGIDNPLLYDAIIIDEFSMVDNNLFTSLLKAGRNIKKICIIGDDNQLPSIRPGSVLNDLISSGYFKVTHLSTNFRQSKDNDIISLANDIIKNDVDLSRYRNNISFINIKDNIDIVSMIQADIDSGYSIDDIQVLAPMYRGLYGIDNLNIELQTAFNPKDVTKRERNIGKYLIREKDKILQLKNKPSDDVYNGDIGILEEIDFKEKTILINYSGVYIYYSFEDLNEISLAYAMSVHKSQGSEYQAVYFVFSRGNLHMLNKKLIYTAISRAKKKLVLIGEESVFKEGLGNAYRKRETTLIKRLAGFE